MLPSDMRRLKQLEDENTKLRKLVADLSLNREMLQDVIRQKWKACSQARAGGRCP
jgi:putative transposase